MHARRSTNAHRVILLGGAPCSGKTTAAQSLAFDLGIACISVDDLRLAASAVTNRQTHPGLHIMAGMDYRDYYIHGSAEQLIADAKMQHRAMWPAISAVIRAHSCWAQSAVIEGWGFLPDQVSKLSEGSLAAIWLVANKDLYESRLRSDKDFCAGASDHDRLLEQYLARTLWFDGQVREQARVHGCRTIEVLPHWSPSEVANQCLIALRGIHDRGEELQR